MAVMIYLVCKPLMTHLFMQFMEFGSEKDPSSDDEETPAIEHTEKDEANVEDFDSLSIVDKVISL